MAAVGSANLSPQSVSDFSWIREVNVQRLRKRIISIVGEYLSPSVEEALTGLSPDRRISVVLDYFNPKKAEEKYAGDLVEQLMGMKSATYLEELKRLNGIEAVSPSVEEALTPEKRRLSVVLGCCNPDRNPGNLFEQLIGLAPVTYLEQLRAVK